MILALLAACSGEAPQDTADACTDAPALGWADVGQPLLLEYCDTCHTATSTERQGAPEDVVFDTYEQVETLRVSMLYVLESDPPQMPPLLTVPQNDQDLMISWLKCDVGR